MNYIESVNVLIFMKRIFNILCLCLPAVVFIFCGCNYEKMKSTTTTGELTVVSDENVSGLIEKQIAEFTRLNTESKIKLVVKTTDQAIADLCNGDAKTIVSSRELNQKEADVLRNNKLDLKKHQIALDGVGIIVNPSNSVRELNYKELRKILSGEITDWKDLEGDNKDIYSGKIKSFIPRKQSFLHDFIYEKVMDGAEYSKGDVVCSTSTQMLREIKSDLYSIGIISMNWITKQSDTLDEGIKPLKIAEVDSSGRVSDYVGLHQAYIADKSYPLTYYIYILSTDFSMNLSVGFTSFVLAYDGQKIILRSGLVPVTQPVRIIQLN